jgi:DNA repair protein RecO (recombination protein O)
LPWRFARLGRFIGADRLEIPINFSELLLKLTTRHDPQPQLFDYYHEALVSLRSPGALEPALRRFEMRLLEVLGYGLDLTTEATCGDAVDPGAFYIFRSSQGLVPAGHADAGALAGASLLDLAAGRLSGARTLEDARHLLKAARAACLEGRPLATRVVARSMVRRAAS